MAAVVAALVATNMFLFVFFPPYAAQFQAPLGNPPEALPAPDLEAIPWRDLRFTTAQQGGALQASQRGDIDGDGVAELVAVGFYGQQVGLVVVYDLAGSVPAEKANVSWVQPVPWGVNSVTLQPLDAHPGAEVIVGGALVEEGEGNYTAIQVFSWRSGALVRQAGALLVGAHSETVVSAVLPPFVGHGRQEAFQSLSTEYAAEYHTPRAYLTTWRTNATGGLEPANVTVVDGSARYAAALVCPSCNGSAAAVGVIGVGRIQVFVPDPLQGPTALLDQGAPGFFWQSGTWLGEGREWEFVALGQDRRNQTAGLASFVLNVTLTGARVGAYVPSGFDVLFRFSNSQQVPDHFSRPWTRANGTARELTVVLLSVTSEQTTSTAYRAQYARGATPISAVEPVWSTHNATMYDVADWHSGSSQRTAYVGAVNDEPAIMLEG